MVHRHNNSVPVTELLYAVSNGSSEAYQKLFPLVYDSLRQIARSHLSGRSNQKTIATTDLVHDTYIKLISAEKSGLQWAGRSHFFAVASRAMRQILIDYARRKNAQKRGDGYTRVTLKSKNISYELNLTELITLDQALDTLGSLNERLRKVVEYRFYGGMNEAEIAEVLGISTRTVERDWLKARMFLHQELYPEDDHSG